MKYLILPLLFLLSVKTFSQVTDTLITATYKIEKLNDHSALNVTFSVSASSADSSKDLTKKFFGYVGSRIGPGAEDVKNAIVKEIEKNKDLELYVQIPSYITEMTDLIKNREERKKAVDIYIANNKTSSSQFSNSSSVENSNGITKNNSRFSITVLLLIRNPTSVYIPEQKFVYVGNMYTIRPFQIQLQP